MILLDKAFDTKLLIHALQNAGAHSFSVGITESMASSLLLELSADDIQYFYQR